MTNYLITPAMGLVVPTPGLEPGPEYAIDISNDLITIDGHKHSGAPGDGYQLNSNALNINADVSWQNHNITNLRSDRFVSQGGPLTGSADLNALYVVNGNLYFNNSSGVPIEVTVGGGVSPAGFTAYTIQIDNSANWTILSTDPYNVLEVLYTSTGAAIVNLPSSVTLAPGRFYLIKDAAGNAFNHNITINVAGSSGDTIEGQASYLINTNFGSVLLWTDALGSWFDVGNVINLTGPNGLMSVGATSNLNIISGGTFSAKSGSNMLLNTEILYDITFAGTQLGQTLSTSTPHSFNIVAQGTSSGAHPGGNLVLSSGTSGAGNGSAGNIILETGGITQMVISPIGATFFGNGGAASFQVSPWTIPNQGQYNFYGLMEAQVETAPSGSNVSFFTLGIPIPNNTTSFIELSWIRRTAGATINFANKGAVIVQNASGSITVGSLVLAYPSGSPFAATTDIDLAAGTNVLFVSAVADTQIYFWQLVATVHTC